MQELSNCCKKPVNIDSKEGNTPRYMCSKCGKACSDIIIKAGGQLIDNDFIDKVSRKIDEEIKKRYGDIPSAYAPWIAYAVTIDIYMQESKQYKQLKRLDWNIKKILTDPELTVISRGLLESLYDGD